jgi:ubiquinone/menaquinone biosynthesis C-methylase UbiE
MTMAEVLDKKKIRQVFRNVQKHRRIEQLIREFSSNKDDIRITALNQVDLTHCQNVLELGCAFGSFTEALKNRLHPETKITGLDIVPEYEPFFLEACKRAGYSGNFSSTGVHPVKKYPTGTFDLVICSFALYFFVEMIPDIARILKKDGIFITITHDQCNMQELIALTKTILKKNKLLSGNELLPIEIILRQFSAENGTALLSPYFRRIQQIDFNNSLIFKAQETEFFLEYYQFKRPFFLTGTNTLKNDIFNQLRLELQKIALNSKTIKMCKDDRIFICLEPLSLKETS